MDARQRELIILLADDDPEDRMLIREAFEEAGVRQVIDTVSDGEQLLAYLRRLSPFEHAHRPDILLLDLNMPVKDGREALAEIRADPVLQSLPVVVLTTSADEADITGSYTLGVNSYVRKPATFDRLVEVARSVGQYWAGTVELPGGG